MNQGTVGEYAALLPHEGAWHRMDALLESASPDCDCLSTLEAAIKTLRPRTSSNP